MFKTLIFFFKNCFLVLKKIFNSNFLISKFDSFQDRRIKCLRINFLNLYSPNYPSVGDFERKLTDNKVYIYPRDYLVNNATSWNVIVKTGRSVYVMECNFIGKRKIRYSLNLHN